MKMFEKFGKWMMFLALMTAAAMASDAPAGVRLVVRLDNEISSGTAHVGDEWTGVLSRDAKVDGRLFAKAGSHVRGVVANVKSSGRLKDPGKLSLRVTSVDGKAVRTSLVSFTGESHKKSNAVKIGGGAAAGALIGGLLGGGKGVAAGAAIGAGGGTAAAAATGKKEAIVPAESAVVFTTVNPKSENDR